MSKGRVKWFNDCKGYGFIINDRGQEVFVHYSSIKGEGYKTLRPGDEVEYDLLLGPKGLLASNVSRSTQLGVNA